MMPNIASSLPPSWLSWRTPCELLPSRREGYFRWLMLAAVALSPWAGFVPLQYLLPAYVVFVGQAILLLRCASTSAPISVLQKTANGWRLTDELGEIYLAELDGPVRDWPGLLCLSFRQRADDALETSSTHPAAEKKRKHWRLAIWSDQLSTTQWRRLRVNVLWRRRQVPRSYLQPVPSAQDNPRCNAGRATRDGPRSCESSAQTP